MRIAIGLFLFISLMPLWLPLTFILFAVSLAWEFAKGLHQYVTNEYEI